MATACILLFTTSSLLCVIALYIDVALSLRIAGVDEFPQALLERIVFVREIGTSAATSALFMFIISIGIIGWRQSRFAGIVISIVALATFVIVWIDRSMIFGA